MMNIGTVSRGAKQNKKWGAVKRQMFFYLTHPFILPMMNIGTISTLGEGIQMMAQVGGLLYSFPPLSSQKKRLPLKDSLCNKQY